MNFCVAHFVKQSNSYDSTQKSHFGRLHSRSYSFSQYPTLMPIAENCNKDGAKYSKLCLLRQFSLHGNQKRCKACLTCFANSGIYFFILPPVTRKSNPKTNQFFFLLLETLHEDSIELFAETAKQKKLSKVFFPSKKKKFRQI